MPDAVWPSTLTRSPRVSDLSETTPSLVIRSQVDVGIAKARRRVTSNARVFSVALDLTAAETETFDQFFVTACNGGATPFEWIHPRTEAPGRFRFIDQPTYSPQGPNLPDQTNLYRVSFNMELISAASGAIVAPPGDGLPPHLSPTEDELLFYTAGDGIDETSAGIFGSTSGGGGGPGVGGPDIMPRDDRDVLDTTPGGNDPTNNDPGDQTTVGTPFGF